MRTSVLNSQFVQLKKFVLDVLATSVLVQPEKLMNNSQICLTWFAPKGIYSATIIDTELRVITSSSSSRI